MESMFTHGAPLRARGPIRPGVAHGVLARQNSVAPARQDSAARPVRAVRPEQARPDPPPRRCGRARAHARLAEKQRPGEAPWPGPGRGAVANRHRRPPRQIGAPPVPAAGGGAPAAHRRRWGETPVRRPGSGRPGPPRGLGRAAAHESRKGWRPLCRRLGEPRPELDMDLNPSRPGDRRPEASPLVDGSGPVRICRSELVSRPLRFYRAGPA
jgi:hypothetical protein